MQKMTMAAKIREALVAAFPGAEVEVVDDSTSHAGHAGAPEGGESHFIVTVKAAEFEGKSRLERHRAVHTALGAGILDRIHALGLNLSA